MICVLPSALVPHRLQDELGGAVLLLGERLRVDDVQFELAAGGALVGLEHLLDAARVVAQRHQLLGRPVGIEEMQLQRLLQAGEDALGACRNRVELLLGEVQPGIGEQQAGGHVEGQEPQRDQQQPGPGIDDSFHVRSLRRLSSGRRPRRWPPARRRSA